jgi:hypothetical protein
MRGVGAVTIGGVPLYAYFHEAAGRVRVRVSADEADRLDLLAGRRLAVGLPGRAVADLLVSAVRREPPFAWAEFEAVGVCVV